MPAGTDTTYLIRMTKEQLVALVWKVKRFKVTGAQITLPSNGYPFGGATDSYSDFTAECSTIPGIGSIGFGWGLPLNDGGFVPTPRTDSGRSFIQTPQTFGGLASGGDLLPASSTPGSYFNAKTCGFLWNPFGSDTMGSGNPNLGGNGCAQYDPENECFWVTPPSVFFCHGRYLWQDFGGGATWNAYSNNINACTTSTLSPYGTELPSLGNVTLNLWDMDPIQIPIISAFTNVVGTDGAGAGVTASATIEVHEEWDY